MSVGPDFGLPDSCQPAAGFSLIGAVTPLGVGEGMMERGHRVGGIFDPKTDALLGVLAILGSYGEGVIFVVPIEADCDAAVPALVKSPGCRL